jgi:hypothetical protein
VSQFLVFEWLEWETIGKRTFNVYRMGFNLCLNYF